MTKKDSYASTQKGNTTLLGCGQRREIQNADNQWRNKTHFSSEPDSNMQTNAPIVIGSIKEGQDCETKVLVHFLSNNIKKQ